MTGGLWYFCLLVYGSLALGLAAHRLEASAPRIMRWTILLVEPWLYAYSGWVMDWRGTPGVAAVPLTAVAIVLIPLVCLPAVARHLTPERRAQGSLILAGAFSNTGTTGGAFLCYLWFGQAGLSLAYLYGAFYPFLVFTLGFALARQYGSGPLSAAHSVAALLSDPVSAVPLLAMAVGLALNLAGVRPPGGAAWVVDGLIKADVGIMCFAIGTTLARFGWPWPWRLVFANAAIKFLALPALAGAASLMVYGPGFSLPARVIVIQASMPTAVYAVIMANLFGLDRNVASALWLSSTLLLAPLAAMVVWVIR